MTAPCTFAGRRIVAILATALVTLAGIVPGNGAEGTNFRPAHDQFAQAVAEELKQGVVPGFSVAWVVDGQTVHVSGYGQADSQRAQAATAETIYRAGSISKLFNAVAAMQLVESGKLDLDAPIQAALPDFFIDVPFARAAPITIRQMLCHRSGMIREAPLGGYLDPSQPSVEATVRSVAGCALVNPPNSVMRYSNVGPTIVGRAVEQHSGMPYAEYQRQHVLGPLGMTSSAWRMDDQLRPRLAKGRMRIARGDDTYYFEDAPEFELGTIPAGNLYTTAGDLAGFAAFLMSGEGSGELSPPLIHPGSLEMMITPQLIDANEGFGLGFHVGNHRGHKAVQHSGAVYGFSTRLVVLPEKKIGVVVLANCDIASGRVAPLAELSLDLLLNVVHGEEMPKPPATIEVPSDELAQMAGQYESESYWARLKVDGTSLVGELSGQPLRLSPTAPRKFLADGRILFRSPFEFERDGDGSVNAFTAVGQRFQRISDDAPAVSEAWQALLGKYGPRFIPLVVSAKHGHLYATVENEYDYRLKPLNRVTFRLPPGMYADEQVVFQLDPSGKAIGAIMANQYLPRVDD